LTANTTTSHINPNTTIPSTINTILSQFLDFSHCSTGILSGIFLRSSVLQRLLGIEYKLIILQIFGITIESISVLSICVVVGVLPSGATFLPITLTIFWSDSFLLSCWLIFNEASHTTFSNSLNNQSISIARFVGKIDNISCFAIPYSPSHSAAAVDLFESSKNIFLSISSCCSFSLMVFLPR